MKKLVVIENNILATLTIRKKLTQALMDEGYQVTVLTTGTESELNLARQMGIKVINVKTGGEKILEVINYFWKLRRSIRQIKPDLILTFTIRPNILGNIIAKFYNIPVISNITGTGLLFSDKRMTLRIARSLYKFALSKTRWVFFQNIDDQELFVQKKMVRKSLTSIIPGSGVDTSYFIPMNKESQSTFSFLFIARLIKDKGVVEYVDAARNIKKNHPDINFRILGPVWNQSIKSNTITRGELNSWVADKVVSYEGGGHTDVRPFIASSDCVVLPSYREGMSNVLLEAGSMAKPCIATNVIGCKEIVVDKETGLLCKPKDTHDLADKMLEMYKTSSQARAKMGSSARIRVQKYFEKHIVIDEYFRIIANIFSS